MDIDYYEFIGKQKSFDIFVMVIQVSITIQKDINCHIMTYSEIQVQILTVSIFKEQRQLQTIQSYIE